MRPLFFAVLLLSCVSDQSHRKPPAQAPEPTPVPTPVIVAAPAPPPAPQPEIVAARTPPPAPVDPRAATRQAAHDVLAEHCGECHEGHRSTAPKALAVFDLDQPDWPSRFDEHRFASALRRLEKKPEPARSAFIAFRDAELAATVARAN